MRLPLLLAAAGLLLAAPDGSAQGRADGIRPTAGLELTYWLLGGSYSRRGQSRWGPTARVGLRPSPTSALSAGLALAYASEGSYEPGLAGAALVDVPVGRSLALQPQAQLVKPLGSGEAGLGGVTTP